MIEAGLISGGTQEFIELLNVGGIIPAILLTALSWFVSGVINRFLNSFGERFTSKRLLIKQVSVFIRFLILGLTLFWVASLVFELSGEGLSFLIGLVLFGVSLSSKDLIASLMSGVILLFDKPFQVGDRIAFDGIYGEVVEIGLRSVRIVDLGDNLISIPNNQFLNAKVSSANAGNLEQMCVMDFYIGPTQDYHLAMKIVYESVAASSYVYCSKKIEVYMQESPMGTMPQKIMINITAKAYVIDGRYECSFVSDVHVRVKDAFRNSNIVGE